MKELYYDRYRQMGARIAMYRKLNDLTQEQLADLVDCGPSFIAQIEVCRNAPSLDMLFAIADALGVTADKLLEPVPETFFLKPRAKKKA